MQCLIQFVGKISKDKRMEKLEELLLKIENVPEGLGKEQLMDWLKEQDMLIGKQQHSLSPTSEAYAKLKARRELVEEALKTIRRMAREQRAEEEADKKELWSGLVPKGTVVATEEVQDNKGEPVVQTKSEEQKKKELEAIHGPDYNLDKISDEIWCSDDVEAKKRLYREACMEAEKGDIESIMKLAYMKDWDTPGSYRLRAYAAERGSETAKWELAWTRKDEASMKYLEMLVREGKLYALFEKGDRLRQGIGGYTQDYRQASEYFARYIEQRGTLDMDIAKDAWALFYYHTTSFYAEQKSGEITKLSNPEYVEEQLKILPELIKKEDVYCFVADVLKANHRYEEAIGKYFELGDKYLRHILDLFFKLDKPAMRQKLNEILTNKLNSQETGRSVRGMLANWYGWRYENEKEVIKDKVKAFEYYWKAEKLDDDAGKKNRIRLLMEAVESKELSSEMFLEKIGEIGYWDAYKYLGDRYAKVCGPSCYQKAQEYYMYAQNGSMKDECEKLCEKMRKRVEQADGYSVAEQLLETDRYEEGFKELLKLSADGFPEACMTVAMISEKSDSYLSLKLNTLLLPDEEIFENYHKAAEAGLRDAQRRMVEIYKSGLFGVPADAKMQEFWEDRLV